MENQTKRDVERAVLLKLREAVNSPDEFEWVESQLAPADGRAHRRRSPTGEILQSAHLIEQAVAG